MQIPADYRAFMELSPEQVEQLCDEIAARPLDAGSIDGWLQDWAAMMALFQEPMARFDVASDVNTADEAARERVRHFRETYMPINQRFYQHMAERLEAHTDLLPDSVKAARARQAAANSLNQSPEALELLTREASLIKQFDTIQGAQLVRRDGEILPLRRMRVIQQEQDRARRERAWRLVDTRRSQDR